MTIEQIYNWRTILRDSIGPYADIATDKEIEEFKKELLNKMETIRNEHPIPNTTNSK